MKSTSFVKITAAGAAAAAAGAVRDNVVTDYLVTDEIKMEYLKNRRIKKIINDSINLATRGKNINVQIKIGREIENILCRLFFNWYNSACNDTECIQNAKKELNKLYIRNVNIDLIIRYLESDTDDSNLQTLPNQFSVIVSPNSVQYNYHEFQFTLLKNRIDMLKDQVTLGFVSEIEFERNVLKMLLRYDSMICQNGNFWSIPEPVWKVLIEFGVEYEGFASPLNFNIKKYFSLFSDTDNFFGSLGSFFETSNKPSGKYVLNPPYTEHIIDKIADTVLDLLESDIIYTFIIILPLWTDMIGYLKIKEHGARFLISESHISAGHRFDNLITGEHIYGNFSIMCLILTNSTENFDSSLIANAFLLK